MSEEPTQGQLLAQARQLVRDLGDFSGILLAMLSGGKWGSADLRMPDGALLVRVGNLETERQRVRESLERTVEVAGFIATSVLGGVTTTPEEVLRQRDWLWEGRTYQVASVEDLRDAGFVVAFTGRSPHVSVFFDADALDDVTEAQVDAFVSAFDPAQIIEGL